MRFQAFGRVMIGASSAVLLLLASSMAASARDAYWHGVRSADWNHGISGGVSNWYSLAPPSGLAKRVPDGDAIFANGALRLQVTVKKFTSIGLTRFLPNAPQYAFRIEPGGALTL